MASPGAGDEILAGAGAAIGGAVAGATTAASVTSTAIGAAAANVAAQVASQGLAQIGVTVAASTISAAIPGIGAAIGALVAIGTFLSDVLSKRPSPEFSREFLAVLRCYPNVLRDYIDKGDELGLSFDYSWYRTKWGYLSVLREQAGEKGYDVFNDEKWQKDFEKHRAELKAVCPRLPNFSVIGITPSQKDIDQAVVDLRIKLAGLPFDVKVEPVVGGLHMKASLLLPGNLLKKTKWTSGPTQLFIYKNKIPIFFDALPPQELKTGPEASAYLASKMLTDDFKSKSWFRGVRVRSDKTGSYLELHVRARPKKLDEKKLASTYGEPVHVVVDRPDPKPAPAPATAPAKVPALAQSGSSESSLTFAARAPGGVSATWLWVLGAVGVITLGGAIYYVNKDSEDDRLRRMAGA